MPVSVKPDTLRVQVSEDRLEATLSVPYNVSLSELSVESIRHMLEEANVEWNDDVAARVQALLQSPRVAGKTLTGVVARGVAPKHGQDGRINWTIDREHEYQIATSNSYYDRSVFIVVEAGQILGRLILPTPGEPGRDVTGKVIAQRSGKPAPMRFDETIRVDNDGTLIAQAPGLLVRTERAALIQQVLVVNDGVDFSTGNIDFQGSVVIRRDVKDRFEVRATRNIEIMGMVEAATIECGGDLMLAGGFAGREVGRADVGGDMNARYLDGITAEVRGNLAVTREIINCGVTVHGSAQVPGAIIGGRFVITGRLTVGSLGSKGAVRSIVAVGTVPRLEPMYRQLEALRDEYRERIKGLETRQRQIRGLPEGDRLSETNQRRLVEIEHELPPLRRQCERAEIARAALERRINELRVVDVHVERRLHEGVVIEYQQQGYRINRAVDGPVHILLDPDGVLIYRTNTDGGPLSEIAELTLTRVAEAA